LNQQCKKIEKNRKIPGISHNSTDYMDTENKDKNSSTATVSGYFRTKDKINLFKALIINNLKNIYWVRLSPVALYCSFNSKGAPTKAPSLTRLIWFF